MKKKIFIKIFKVIVVIFACIGVFFSGFFLVTMIRTAINKQPKESKAYGYNDEYGIQLYMTDADFHSNYFIINFISALSLHQAHTSISYNNDDIYRINFDNTDGELGRIWGYVTDTTFYNIDLVSFAKINVEQIEVDANNDTYARELVYTLSFYNNNNIVLEYRYWVSSPLYNDNSHDLGVTCIRVLKTSSFDNDNTNKYWCYIENNLNLGGTPFIDYFYNFTRDKNYANYERGYSDGYSYGEYIGYNKGFEEGSNGASSNPFKMVELSFESIASILNIQVLPHITLGILIFTPMIFGIIIVLFRMIKG